MDLEWRRGSESLFERSGLQRLYVNGYDGGSSDPFRALTALRELRLFNAKLTEIKAFARLEDLDCLQLRGLKGLVSLDGLQPLSTLDELEIQACPAVRSIEEIAGLKNLRRLLLIDDGEIESLSPLAEATSLEELYFYGTTNIADGDLSPLLELPRLREVSFQDRRHYSTTRQDLWAQLGRRSRASS